MAEKITPREKDYSQWYVDIVTKAKLADYSPVKGCMVIRPNGYTLWEKMREIIDRMFKETGHVNAYFPLFIPKSFLSKEAEHVEGFAKECAVVTHHRLREAAGGGVEVDPTARLEEELVIRPTSETIIWAMYKKWIMSYRDLPILINQWANVVRWEMRTRLFLRTTEFLWQEGHTAHASSDEAREETLKILDVYRTFAEDYMAIPVIAGIKTEKEKFAGAVATYGIEAMMQDYKALQAGTSHFLGQNFAKAFDVTFQDKDGERKLVWASSWGVSTRLIGALIMSHSDDKGLVIPPRLASRPVVIVPIWRSSEEQSLVMTAVTDIKESLRGRVEIIVDDRDQYKPGWKFHEWELQGIPVRLEIGPRDIADGKVVLARRTGGPKEPVAISELSHKLPEILEEIQQKLFTKAKTMMNEHIFAVTEYAEFRKLMKQESGWAFAPWCGEADCEQAVQEETKATIRVIPLDEQKHVSEGETCVRCGQAAVNRVYFARAY